MFDGSYACKYVGSSLINYKEHTFNKHVYTFKAAKRTYLVWVEEHAHKTFILKFFVKKNEKSNLKFNVLVGDYDASKIIATCINIMLQILEENKNASFAFVGVYTHQEGVLAERGKISKRFSIYRKLMANKFGSQNFQHTEVEEKNAYLMCNVNNTTSVNKQIISNLISCYPSLDAL